MRDFSVTIYESRPVKVESKDAERIFDSVLDKLKEDRWTENGKLREEHVTSHRYDADCDDQSDFEFVETIEKLQRMLKERRKR